MPIFSQTFELSDELCDSPLSEISSGTPSKFGFTDDRFLEAFIPEESVPASFPSKIDSNPSSLISKARFVLAWVFLSLSSPKEKATYETLVLRIADQRFRGR